LYKKSNKNKYVILPPAFHIVNILVAKILFCSGLRPSAAITVSQRRASQASAVLRGWPFSALYDILTPNYEFLKRGTTDEENTYRR
jgi:hypothetical protein